MPTALITGITGQDGGYLAELLLSRGYRVVGLTRDPATARAALPDGLASLIELVPGDLRDEASLAGALSSSAPDEIYNLAAESFVQGSWADPVGSAEVTGLGVARLLEAIRRVAPGARICHASSSEIFGDPAEVPQRESTPLAARSPYGAAKVYAHLLTGVYRQAHGLHASAAILFNHESPRRPPRFVTRKITRGAAAVRLGRQDTIALGNLDARRDWGYAADYVEAMWRMLQQERPSDYVIGTGESRSVREFCAAAFAAVGLDYREHVVVDPALCRPADPGELRADAARARSALGWTPSVSFEELVSRMVRADLAALGAE